MSLRDFKLDTIMYSQAKKYAEAEPNDKLHFRSEKKLLRELDTMCVGINNEILNHIKTGFSRMEKKPCMSRLMSDAKEYIVEKQPDYITLESTGTFGRHTLEFCGLRFPDYGLPPSFAYEEYYDFWALCYGLIGKFAIKGLTFHYGTTYTPEDLTYQSVDDCFSRLILPCCSYDVTTKDLGGLDYVAKCDSLLSSTRWYIADDRHLHLSDTIQIFLSFCAEIPDRYQPGNWRAGSLKMYRKKRQEQNNKSVISDSSRWY